MSAIGTATVSSAALKMREYSISVMRGNQSTQHTPCLSINIGHHEVKGIGAIVSNMVECINVSLINIQVGVGWKLRRVMPSRTPLMNCSIKLFNWSKLGYQDVVALTAVATRATIGIGTSCLNTPSLPIDVGKWLCAFQCKACHIKERKWNDILFESVGIGCSPWTKISILDNRNNPRVSIWSRAVWKDTKRVALRGLESGYTAKEKTYIRCHWERVTVGRQLVFNKLHDIGRWSNREKAEVYQPGAPLLYLRSEKGNPHAWLRVSANIYLKRVTRDGLTRRHIIDRYSASNSSRFLILPAFGQWDWAAVPSASEIMEHVRAGSGKAWMKSKDARRCANASWKIKRISGVCMVSVTLLVPGNRTNSVSEGHW